MMIYEYDQAGVYLGSRDARLNPAYGFDHEVDQPEYLVPAFTTPARPPEMAVGEFARWTGNGWVIGTVATPG